MHSFTIGMEEEFFLVDKATRALVPRVPNAFFLECRKAYPEQIVGEFLRCQVELISKPCSSISDLYQEQKQLRKTLVEIADHYGLAPIASSTHPFSSWLKQQPNKKPRYQYLFQELQASGRRMAVCGMHLHNGIENIEERLLIFNRLYFYLPYFLALSTSSPFWEGHDTGLNSFRLSVIDGLPRSGMPPRFENIKDYQEGISHLIKSSVIKDASEIWWDARLNKNYPTIELRIMDICTRLQDTTAIGALYACLIEWIRRNKHEAHLIAGFRELITNENRWRVQRYPVKELSFLDFKDTKLISAHEFYKNWISELTPIALELKCEHELNGVFEILKNGTSADKQRNLFNQSTHDGCSRREALVKVVDHLIKETRL
ncbi:MAG: carboxylate-amine ligase [Proteobacteria bacterium]|nr:carboxylate-amine ligase [Pseudomonadota bacterium]